MALKVLQSGIEPLGQFDIEDDDLTTVVGGEVVRLGASDASEYNAADVGAGTPDVLFSLGSVTADGVLYGLADEGSSGYGTAFGTVIGGSVGQGTGYGASSSQGVTVVGPTTAFASGKVTVWTKPGLYGATGTAFNSTSGATANTALYGVAGSGSSRGKLTTSSSDNGVSAALYVGSVTDSSLVTTTQSMAGATVSETEYHAIYLLGVQAA